MEKMENMENMELKETIITMERRIKQSTQCTVLTLIFLVAIVLTLVAFSAYLCFQPKSVPSQFQGSENVVNGRGLKELDAVLYRELRQGRDGTQGQAGARGAAGARGRNGAQDRDGAQGSTVTTPSPSQKKGGEFVTSVAFIHWGKTDCPPGDVKSLLIGEPNKGIIAAFHDEEDNIVPGSDILCVPKLEKKITGGQQAPASSLKLLPVNFNLHDHLYCAHCFVKASGVITLIGQPCPSPDWSNLYSGTVVTSNGSGGTSQSICVALNPVHAGSSANSPATVMQPVASGTSALIKIEAHKVIPCNVCYRKISSVLASLDG